MRGIQFTISTMFIHSAALNYRLSGGSPDERQPLYVQPTKYGSASPAGCTESGKSCKRPSWETGKGSHHGRRLLS